MKYITRLGTIVTIASLLFLSSNFGANASLIDRITYFLTSFERELREYKPESGDGLTPDGFQGQDPSKTADNSLGGDALAPESFWETYDKLANPLLQNLPPDFKKHYAYFLIFYIVLILYSYLGSFRNKRIAKKFLEVVEPVLDDNFAYLERKKSALIPKSWHSFEIYASGRTSCKSVIISLELVKRECFWQENIIRLVFPSRDRVAVEVTFDSLDSISFAICHRRSNKEFISYNQELLRYSTTYDCKDVPDCFRMYINSPDKSVTQYANHVLSQIRVLLPILDSFYISDSASMDGESNSRPELVAVFYLTNNTGDYSKIIRFVMDIIDYSKNYSLPVKVREAIVKERTNIKVASEKNAKTSKEEENDTHQHVTPEKLKKLEEKLLKKSKNPAVPGIKIKKIK